MFDALTPLTTGILAAIVLATVVAIAVCFLVDSRQHRGPSPRRAAPPSKLPSGADAALWSIVEAVPDPRNHLALTRDLSGEVHITADDRDAVAAMFADEAKVERIPSSLDLREPVQPPSASDTRKGLERQGSEELTLTDQLFFSGRPQLNRF